MTHKNGQMRMGYANMGEVLQEINRNLYPFGIEQYNVNPTLLDVYKRQIDGHELYLFHDRDWWFVEKDGLDQMIGEEQC